MELAKLAKNGLLIINTIITCVKTHYTLYSQHVHAYGSNNRLFISKCMSPSTNATSWPWNHTIERILDHLLFQVAACCNNRFKKLSQIVWLLIMWHIPDFMFEIAPKKKNRILLGEWSGQGQSPCLLITRPGNSPQRYITLLHCWYGKELHLTATTCHPYRYCEHTKVSLYNVVGVWFGGTFSCWDFFQQSVDPEQRLTSSNQPTNWTIIARKW